MAAIDWDDVVDVAAELAAVADGAQTAILAYVNGNGLAVDIFDGEAGETTFLARVNLAAHMGSSVGAGAAAGPIISETEGGLSRSYANLATDSELGATSYGRMFKWLCRMNAGGAWLARPA